MTYLALETSDPRGSLVLFDEERVLEEVVFPEGLVHAREFAADLEQLLRQHDVATRALRGVAVSVGPGSYTGCRVGVTAAKSLAFALRIPMVGISSLEVLAAGSGSARLVGTILDGRRGFFYAALFQLSSGRPMRLVDDQVGTVAEMAGALGRAAAARGVRAIELFGDGAEKFASSVTALVESGSSEIDADVCALQLSRGSEDLDLPRARTLASLARPEMASAEFDLASVHALAPAYLRPSEPEIVLAKKLAAKGGSSASGRQS